MANVEESSPFLPSQKSEANNNEMKPTKPSSSISGKIPAPSEPVKPASSAVPMGWTADGLPMGHGVGTAVVGEPIMRRAQWESSLCSCFGKNDEFVSSDFEVCEFSFYNLFKVCCFECLFVYIKVSIFVMFKVFKKNENEIDGTDLVWYSNSKKPIKI